MAVAARQTRVIRGDNGVNFGHVVDTVVDERTGVAAQREQVFTAVHDEHGDVIVMIQERIHAVKLWAGDYDDKKCSLCNCCCTHCYGSTVGRGDTYFMIQDDNDKPGACSLCNFCCMLCFLPCMASIIFLAMFAFLVLIPAIILIAMTAVGPIQCTTTALAIPASAVTIALIGVTLFILLLCTCIQCCKGEYRGHCRAIIYCCNCLAIIAFLGLMIAGSVLVYLPKEKTDTDCRFLGVPLAIPMATIALSYMFVISTCCCWVLHCYAVLKVGSRAYSSG